MRRINSIFIVDDDPITIFGIKKMLSLVVDCPKVETYGNGKEALSAIKELLGDGEPMPDVMFLDVNMPIMDGWQFLEEFTALPITQRIKINVITSSIDPYDQEKWAYYQSLCDHDITYNSKPVHKMVVAEMAQMVPVR